MVLNRILTLRACLFFIFVFCFISGSHEARSSKGRVNLLVGGILGAGDNTEVQVSNAIQLRIDQYNQNGKFNITYLPRFVATAKESNDAALELINLGVVAVIGIPYSSFGSNTAVTFSNAKIPVISHSATAPSLSDRDFYPFFMRTIPSDLVQARAIYEFVRAYGWSQIAVLSATDVASLGLNEGLTSIIYRGSTAGGAGDGKTIVNGTAPHPKKTVAEGGISILTNIFFTVQEDDVTGELENIQRTGARIIIAFASGNDFPRVMLQAKGLELTGKPYVYITSDSNSYITPFITESGGINLTVYSAIEGSFATSPRSFDTKNSPAISTFMKELSQIAPVPDIYPYTTYGYDAVSALVLALDSLPDNFFDSSEVPIKNSSSGNTTAFQKGDLLLQAIMNVSFQGLSGKIQFDQNGDRLFGEYNLLSFDLRDENGKPIEPNGGDSSSSPNETNLFIEVAYFDENQDVILEALPRWPPKYSNAKDFIPDDTPHDAVDYYDCTTGKSDTDTRGLINTDTASEDDPRYIPQDFVCDGVVDCVNLSDEDFSCSPSIDIGYIVLGIIAIIGIIIIVIGAILVVWYSPRARIRVSGFLFLEQVSLACFVGTGATFTFYGRANDASCILRFWLIFLAAGTLISALCLKQWRIWKLFSNTRLVAVTIPNSRLILMTVIILIPDLILLVLWTALDELRARDDSDMAPDHLFCWSDNFYVYLFILVGYQGLLLVASSILAILTRRYGSYGESKLIGFALYNATIISAIFIPIIFALNSQYFLQWLVGVIYNMFFFLSIFFILLSDKIYGSLVTDRGRPEEELRQLPFSFNSHVSQAQK